jgi:hypothetical protein
MKYKILLFAMLLGYVSHTKGQITQQKHPIVSLSVNEAFYQYVHNGRFQNYPKTFFSMDLYPLSWLSIGMHYSYQKLDRDLIIPSVYRIIGGKIALHTYPIFEWAQLEYVKDHFDFYLAGLVEEDYRREISHKGVDPDTGELQEPYARKQRFYYTGYSCGMSYFIVPHAGVNFEYTRTGKHLTLSNVYKAGIIVRF